MAVVSQAWAQTPPQKPPAQPVARTQSAAAGASAAPREDAAESQRLFRELDRNRDGCLTPDELWAPGGQRENWAAIDRNRNGCIAPDEFTVLRAR